MENSKNDNVKKGNISLRGRRYFSEAARRSIVEEIEKGLGKADAARRYEVSETSIYKWIVKYSSLHQKQLKTVVEHQSDSERLKRAEAELRQVYEQLGRERSKSMFFEQLVKIAGEDLGMDLKKNFGSKLSEHSTEAKTAKGPKAR